MHQQDSAFLPSAILIFPEIKKKADVYFAGLTSYYERFIRTTTSHTLFGDSTPNLTFQVYRSCPIGQEMSLAWTTQRSKAIPVTVLRDEMVPGISSSTFIALVAREICRHICLDALLRSAIFHLGSCCLFKRLPQIPQHRSHATADTSSPRIRIFDIHLCNSFRSASGEAIIGRADSEHLSMIWTAFHIFMTAQQCLKKTKIGLVPCS